MTADAPGPSAAPARRALYGRRHGPRLRPNRKRLLEERLPGLRVDLEAGARIDPAALFPDGRPLWLEIGFGAGEHLAAVAEAHPGVGLIGCEPFVNGAAALLAAVEARGLANVRVAVDDARLLLDALPDRSCARIYVLFPDPWPKTRHKKRRIVNSETARAFERLLAPGGSLEMATDDADYASAMLMALRAAPGLVWAAERAADWRTFPALGHPTRYEAKARAAGRPCVYLRFVRAGRAQEDA